MITRVHVRFRDQKPSQVTPPVSRIAESSQECETPLRASARLGHPSEEKYEYENTYEYRQMNTAKTPRARITATIALMAGVFMASVTDQT